MKTKRLLMIGGAMLLLCGCRSYRGGTTDTYETTYGTGTRSVAPSSETVRPGMNSEDIRDPSSITRPFQPFPGL